MRWIYWDQRTPSAVKEAFILQFFGNPIFNTECLRPTLRIRWWTVIYYTSWRFVCLRKTQETRRKRGEKKLTSNLDVLHTKEAKKRHRRIRSCFDVHVQWILFQSFLYRSPGSSRETTQNHGIKNSIEMFSLYSFLSSVWSDPSDHPIWRLFIRSLSIAVQQLTFLVRQQRKRSISGYSPPESRRMTNFDSNESHINVVLSPLSIT